MRIEKIMAFASVGLLLTGCGEAAYYYKVRILRGTSEYVTSDKVLAVSGAAGVRYGKPECSFDAYVSGR